MRCAHFYMKWFLRILFDTSKFSQTIKFTKFLSMSIIHPHQSYQKEQETMTLTSLIHSEQVQINRPLPDFSNTNMEQIFNALKCLSSLKSSLISDCVHETNQGNYKQTENLKLIQSLSNCQSSLIQNLDRYLAQELDENLPF